MTPSWFRDETQGVCSVLSWCLSTLSRAVYQDPDIYHQDDRLSAVDAIVIRHLFEKWVCCCFLSFLLSKSPVEMREESSGRSLCSRRLSSLCPGVPPSPPFPSQKIHHREILHLDEVRTGTYSRCFQCVGPVGSMLSVQFSSVAQSCLTPCNPMNHSMLGLPVHQKLPEFTQTHAHWAGDAIQPPHPLSSPSPPAPNPSHQQGLFQWVSSSHQVAKVLEFQLQHQFFQWILRVDFP